MREVQKWFYPVCHTVSFFQDGELLYEIIVDCKFTLNACLHELVSLIDYLKKQTPYLHEHPPWYFQGHHGRLEDMLL